MPYDPIIVKVKTDKTTAVVASSGGASFGVVNVTGQNNVVATKTTDILKVRPGTGVSITTDAPNNTLTITATGGSAFDSVARDIANGAFEQANSAALRANTLVTDNVPETTTNLYFTSDRVRGNVSNIFPISYNVTTGEFGVVASNANGSVLISNTISGGYDVSQLTGGLGIIVTTSAGGIKIDAANGGADVFARIQANNAYAHANGAFVKANIATTNADAAFLQANSAALRANTLVTDNVPETSTNLYFTAARVRANVSNTAPINYNPTTGVISHASSGVGATTYGNATFVSQVTIDAFGHVTGASNIAIDQSLAQSARDHANGAFNQANTGNLIASSAALRANTLVTDNVPETSTNLYFTAARVRANISNTAPINYNPTTGVISHADSGITAKTYGNSTLIPQLTVDARGHVTAITNVAITGLPASTANGQLLIGNTVSGSFDVNTLTQGTGITITNDKGSITIAATGGSSLDQFARDQANAAFDKANAANVLAQTSRDHANGAFTKANAATPNTATANGQIYAGNTVSGTFDLTTIAQTAPIIVTNGKGTVSLSHASSGVVATTYGNATFVSQVTVDQFGHVTSASNVAIDQSLTQTARDHANGAFTTANSAYAHANGAFASSNTKVANSGVTVNGSVLIGNTVSGGYDLRTIAQSAPVIVTNDKGSIVLSHARSGVVATGYGDAASIPVFVVDANGHITSVTNTTVAITTSQVTESAGGPFYHTSARVRGNVTNTAPINYDASTGTFSHAASGVTATGYGDAASIPVFVVNATGHVTSVTNTTIAIATSQITSGTLSVARGGTGQTSITVNGAILIANTVSGGYDVNRITQTSPVIVTNDKGSITLSHASSGVTPTTYGNANHVSQITVDGFGHVTSSVNTRIGVGASQITSGATANGQLLIGNTVSGAFDVATLTQGTNITITNDKGAITISSTGGAGGNSFGVVNVAGQSDVVSDQANDTLTIIAGTGIVITTDPINDTITVAATGGAVTDQFARDTANGAFAKANAAVPNTSVTVNGSLQIGNTVSGGYDMRTLTGLGSIVIVNDQGTISINSNTFSTINTIANDANTQGNLVSVGSDTLILEAGPGMNISFTTTNGKEAQFMVNPGYIQAIASGQALHAL